LAKRKQVKRAGAGKSSLNKRSNFYSKNNNKYNATTVRDENGKIIAHSKAEFDRLRELQILEQAGHISDLKSQVPFIITFNGAKICTYVADFTYMVNGKYIVEDKKGYITETYKLKKKLMKAVHNIDILET